jgi:endoglycosylceramidase
MRGKLAGNWVLLLGCILICSGAGAAEPVLRPGLSVQGRRLMDGSGRQVILRGVNAGGRSKLPPFYPFDPTPDFETALDRYADGIQALGFNVVRLLVIYEAAEPVRGQYDEKYLAGYDRMVQAFSRRGIRIIVDAHQDIYSRRLCGDGFPDWTLREKDRDRKQDQDCKMWSVHYFTGPVAKSFDRFWSNADGIQDRYVEFFGMLARRYAAEPAVIGFEPINEPFPGRSGLAHYSKWYEKRLYPLYERVGEAVHSANPRYLVFADICPLENTGLWNSKRARPEISNLVFAPHYYNLGTFGISSGPERQRAAMRQGLEKHQAQSRSWDVPMLVTEYGISPLFKTAPSYITTLYSLFDEFQLSGTFWEASMSATIWNKENTSLFEPDGSVRPGTPFLDRPYPRAVAGTIQAFSFQPESGRFELSWTEGQTSSSGPTEIYLPERIYPREPQIQLEPAGKFQFDSATRVLSVNLLEGGSERRVVVAP